MDKIILITGGYGEIGKACIKKCIQDGYKYISLDMLEEERTTENGIHCKVDLRKKADIKEKMKYALSGLGGSVSYWIHCAGTINTGGLLEMEWDDCLKEFNNNVGPVYNIMQVMVPILKEQMEASIVIVSSIFGVEVAKDLIAYSMAKASAVVLSENMALEFGKYGIRTNCLCPGLIRTKFTQNRIGKIFNSNASLVYKFENLPKSFASIKDTAKMIFDILENGSMNGSTVILDQGYRIQ